MLNWILEGWLQGTLSALVAFMIVYKSIPVLIKIAYHKDLYDKPDGDRKVHTRYIPTFGGVGIFIALALGFLFSGLAGGLSWTPYLIGALTGLFFCGLKDDLIGLSPKKKLLVEIAMVGIILWGSGSLISNFGGVLGIHDLPLWLAVCVSVFTMIVVINAYNLIDGIDGLAGGIGAIASAAFAYGFWVSGATELAYLAGLTSVVLVGYLIHNFHPASIFMGDTGSLVIGFLLSIFVLKFVELSQTSSFSNAFGKASPVLPVAFLAVPLYDTIRSFTRRIRRGQSPFNADSDHIHHALLKMGWGQKRTVIYLYLSATLIILAAYLSTSLNVNISLGLTLLMTIILFPTNGFKRRVLSKMGWNIEGHLRSDKEAILYEHLREAQEKSKRQQKKVGKHL